MATTYVTISTYGHEKTRVCKLPNSATELQNCPLRRLQGLNGIMYRETTEDGSSIRRVHLDTDRKIDKSWLVTDCLYTVAKFICKHCEYNKEKQR